MKDMHHNTKLSWLQIHEHKIHNSYLILDNLKNYDIKTKDTKYNLELSSFSPPIKLILNTFILNTNGQEN